MKNEINDIRVQIEAMSEDIVQNMERANDFGCECFAKISEISDILWKIEKQDKD